GLSGFYLRFGFGRLSIRVFLGLQRERAFLHSPPFQSPGSYDALGSKLIFMKEYQASDIRNFAIVGHASSGKTMLSEAMLATAGVINRMGSIAGGVTCPGFQ